MVEVIDPRVKPEKARKPSPVQVSLHGYSFHKGKPYTTTAGWSAATVTKMMGNKENTLETLVSKMSVGSPQFIYDELEANHRAMIDRQLQKIEKSDKDSRAEWSLAYIKRSSKEFQLGLGNWKKVNHRIDVIFERKSRFPDAELNKDATKSSKNKDTTDPKTKSKKSKKEQRKQKQSDESDSGSVWEDDEPSEEGPPIVVHLPQRPIHSGPPMPPPINAQMPTQMPFRPAMPMPLNNPNVYIPNAQGGNAQQPNIHNPNINNPLQQRAPYQNNGPAQAAGMGQQRRGGPNMQQPQPGPPPPLRDPAPFPGPPPAYGTAPPLYVPPRPAEPPRHDPPTSQQRVHDWQDRDRGSSYYSDEDRDRFWSRDRIFSRPGSPASSATSPSRGGYYRTGRNGERIWVAPGADNRREKERRARERLELEKQARDRERQRSLDRHRQRSRERRNAGLYGNPSDAGRSRNSNSDGSGSRDDAIFADEERKIREREVEERIRGAYRKGLERGRDI